MKITNLQLTRFFFFFTIVILAVFVVGSLLRINENRESRFLYAFYALAMFGDALAMLFCIWMLNKRMKFAFEASVFVLALNILLTVFDQFGVVDLLFVLLNLAALIALIKARKEFLPA